MFGRKKENDASDKVKGAQDIVYGMLMAQIDMGHAADGGANQRRLATAYAFGYIFGFADAMIQGAGIQDDLEIMAQLTVAFTRLFGVTQGSKIFGACLGRQSDPQFAPGRRAGGTEAIQWLSSGGERIPTGLSLYLNSRAI